MLVCLSSTLQWRTQGQDPSISKFTLQNIVLLIFIWGFLLVKKLNKCYDDVKVLKFYELLCLQWYPIGSLSFRARSKIYVQLFPVIWEGFRLGGKIPSCLTQCILISKKRMKKRRITLATWLDSFNKPCNCQLIFSFYPKVTFCLLKCGWFSEINEMIINVFFCLWKLFY